MEKEEYEEIMKKCNSLQTDQEKLDYLKSVVPSDDFYQQGFLKIHYRYLDMLIDKMNKLEKRINEAIKTK